jgi:hypothetical protein
MRNSNLQILLLSFVLSPFAMSDGWAQSIDATTETIGSGFGSGPVTPQLVSTRPVLDQDVAVMISDAPPDGIGYLFLSLPPASPLDLGNGLLVYVDLGASFVAGPFPIDAQGGWVLPFVLSLPSDQWLGAEIRMQAAILNADGDTGFSTTNGMQWLIGDK